MLLWAAVSVLSLLFCFAGLCNLLAASVADSLVFSFQSLAHLRQSFAALWCRLMDFASSYLGAPYVFWRGGECTLDKDEPFYCSRIKSPAYVKKHGCNCAGLINLIHNKRRLPVPGCGDGKKYAGGTYMWYKHLKSIKALEPIDCKKEYPTGSLLLRRYRNTADQGHLALLCSTGPLLQQKLLHSFSPDGVALHSTVAQSHGWIPEGYYEFVAVNWMGLSKGSA